MTLRNRHLSRIAAAALAVSALACLVVAPAFASAIRVLVNDEPITSYDVQQRATMLKLFTGGKSGEKQAIDQLVDEKLMLQEAKRRHVTVSDDELNSEIANRAQAAKMTAAQFSQALKQQGVQPDTFKEFLRANMAWARIVRARFRATVNVTDQDVTAALGARSDAGATQAAVEYMVQPIIFVVPAGSSSAAANERLKAATAFRQGFKGCDQSVAQAGSSPIIVVLPTVRREESGLPDAIKKELAATEIGSATKPERIAEGFQILGVCSKNTIAGETEAAVSVRQEITGERGKLLARRYLLDLRSDAVIEYR